MKWIGRRQSENVNDKRAIGGGGKVAAGGGLIGIVVALVMMFGGENAKQMASGLQKMGGNQGASSGKATRELTKEEKDLGAFSSVCFADNEDIWTKIFAQNGMKYELPQMDLFADQVETACGSASAAMGPFYCPADQKVYMDLRFFEELRTKFGAKGGDFAIAYVIAHEVGHHLQTILGTSQAVNQLQGSANKSEQNRLSVCQELQADFYAGVWAHHNKKNMEEGDMEEALSAAFAVGDDAIQTKMQGRVNQEAFTHGSSKERMRWFMKGYNTGDVSEGDTYAEKGYQVKSF